MDEIEDEIDEFLGSSLNEIERRQDLNRVVAFGATVEFESSVDSVLSRYIASRRVTAMAALVALASHDASDALGISKHQSIVAEYLNVKGWVREQIEAATDADDVLQREYRAENDA